MSARIDLIRGSYASFARLDIDDVLARFADTLTWTIPESDGWGGTYAGKDEIYAFLSGLADRYGFFFKVKPVEFLEAGDKLVVLGSNRVNGDTIPWVHVWTFDGDLADSLTEYVDNAALARHVLIAA